jgi:hypothetical protein
MSINQQYDFIGKQKLLALKALHCLLTDFQLSGEISLLTFGVTERPIEQITILVRSWDELQDFNGLVFTRHDFDDDATIKATTESRFAFFTVHGVNTKAELVKKYPHQSKNEFINSEVFKVAHPSTAYRSAKAFVSNFEHFGGPNTHVIAMSRAWLDIAAYEAWVTKTALTAEDAKVLTDNFGTPDPKLVPIALP